MAKAKIKSVHSKMIKNARKYLKNSTLLLVIGVSLLLGCPSSGDKTTVLPISSSIPASGATNFSADGNIVLTYNQAVVKGEGVITLLTYLPSVGKRVTIAIDDTQVSIAGNVVTIDPPIDLDMGISYILTIPAGVFLNAAGGNAIPADTLFFSTAPAIDITAPAISAAMSVGGATDLSANADIILTFDEPILKGSGEIILTPTVGAPLVIAVSDPRVTIVGGVVTIDPMADLALDTAYTLTIPAGAFVDASGNSSPPDTQSFMTAMALDTTLPMLNSSVPANNATGVAVDANIVLTYDEEVQKGSGSITLQPTGGTVVTIPISTAQVSVAGAVVTINPTVDLLAGTDYTLMVPAGVIDDLAGNSAGSLTLNFATAAAADITPPTINSSAPTSGATINAFDNIVLMYSEAVQKGSGSITLQPSVGTLVTIPISSAQVSVVASVVAIDPTADLVAGTSYTLSFPAGVFQDLAGNNAGSFTLSFNTAAALDTTPPTIASSVPANGATGVAVGANIVLTYSEAVQKGSGSMTISSAGGMVTISVSSVLVSVSGSVVTINPTVDLLDGTSYTLSFPAGVFQDLAGNNAGSLTLNFNTAAALDTTPPVINSSVPANGATGIAVGANIVLTYSEAVQKGSGSMTISSAGGMVTISVSSAQVNVAGAVVTINPSVDLLDGTAYTLSFPAGVFQDLAGNNAGSFTRSFTTAVALDSTPPTIMSTLPVMNGTINSPDNIVLTYSEAVQKGSGNITIGAITIPVSSAQVSIAGAVVTIDPTADLLTGTSYTLSFSAGAFQDLAGNNAGSLTLNFNTAAALDTTPPTIASSVPANGATGVAVGANIVLAYSEAVQKGSGSMTISSAGGMVTISVSSALVSVSGSVVTINPTADLLDGTAYTLSFPAGVFQDLAGNNAGSLTRSFTTAVALDSTPPTIMSTLPAMNGTINSPDNIVLTYSEAVQKGSGNITIGAITIPVSSAQVSIAGAVVTINPSADLLTGTSYTLSFSAGVFQDLAGNNAGSLTLNFNTAAALDTTPPTIASSVPANGATGVAVGANIVLTYSEAVQKGSGSMTISSAGGMVTISVSSAQVNVAGAVVTINPTADLLDGTAYTLSFPAGVFQDLAGNNAGSLTRSFTTAMALDTTPPTIASSVPANNAMNVNIGANVVLTYSEAVQKGSGSITLSSAFGNISVPVSNSLVSISGNVVTIDPMVDLLAGTAYTLSFPAGVFQDLAGNNAGSLTLNFSTAAALDTTPPTIASSVPANGATNVNIGANIVLTYSEAVQKGSGSITLQRSGGGMVTIPVSSAQVSVSGSVVTINPTADLLAGTVYTLSFSAGVFQDLAGNNAGSLTRSFTTAVALDSTPPTIMSTLPVLNGTINSPDNIVLTYSEAVQKGSGNITIGAITIPVSSAQVSIAGAVVTINPSADLLTGTSYTLSFSAGAFQDLAGNNAGSLTLNFSTAAALDTTPPTISSSVPANGATGVDVGANIVLTYSEAVQKGSGSMTISSAGGMVTISVSSALVSVSGAVVTIDPSVDLLDGTSYTLSFPAGVFQDLAGNNAGSFMRSFTTAVALDTTAPTINSSVPAIGGGGTINSPDNIVLTYSEAVQKGSGNITIGAITIPVTDAQVNIAGAVVTINPTADLLTGTSYTLSFSAGAFQDLAGNNAGSLTLNFNTAAALDTTPPTIASSAPADSATGVAVGANIVLTYSEAVQKGSGSMTISSGGGMVTISVSSALVSIAGAVVTINPTADLVAGTSYTLSFPAGVFQDLAGNSAGSFTLNFNTAVALDTTAPTVSSSVPVAGGTLESTANIVLTYNEAVQVGSGNITITASGGTSVTISLSSAQVSIAGAVVTIDPTAALTLTTYALMVPAGAFQDLAGNTSGEYTLSFVTQATMIETIADLENVRNNLAGDYALAANIDISSIDNWQPIGDEANPFTGSFDGQGYQISGLNSSGYQYAGLFGVVAGSSISNLGVLVGTISSSTSGVSYVGGLIGSALARFSDFSRLNSSISNSYVVIGGNISSSTSGVSYVGGLIGNAFSGSSISNSYVVIGGNISSSTSGVSYVGGLIGNAFSGSSISNSYAVVTGNVSSSGDRSSAGGLIGSALASSTISNSYAVVGGNISSSSSSSESYSESYAGGLVGDASDESISNSYAVVGGNISSSSSFSSSSGVSYVGGLAGFIDASLSNSYAVVGGDISSSSSSGISSAGGLVGFGYSLSNSYAVVGGNISSSSSSSSFSSAGGLVGNVSDSLSNSYAIVEGNISSFASNPDATSNAGGLVGRVDDSDTLISNSYYSASRKSSEGNFDNTLGTSQTVAQLRSLTATGTGWMAFFDASSAPAHALITDTSATFATGDRRLWHFGDNAQLPILNPSPAQVTAGDLSLYRARQHFVATASSTTQINLSWSSAGATYTFYEVYQHTANNSSGASLIGSPQVSAVGRTYADTGLTTGTTYYYWLKACAGSVCSDFFANTQATTP